jgi:dTDP-4-amino-4,6-dideoxygalactose transaminase
MERIGSIADKHGLALIEDAAQALGSSYNNKPLGSFGDLSTISFHETKNVMSGEGGALAVNNRDWCERAELIWEKGTNRSQFFRGEVDKYTWVDVGSSFLPSEITAAFLWAQLQDFEAITQQRLEIWGEYHRQLAGAEARGLLKRPRVPSHCRHNGHLYYVLISSAEGRGQVIRKLKDKAVQTIFHYVPLHSSPAGRRLGRMGGSLAVTESLSSRILRLPLWVGMQESDVSRVVDELVGCLRGA